MLLPSSSVPTSQDKNNGGAESCVMYCSLAMVSLSLTPFQGNCFLSHKQDVQK